MQISLSDTTDTPPAGHLCPDMHQKASEWRARLRLRYAAVNGKTTLVHQHHTGPLMVQKPFYPEGPGVCHTYLIHPPGGVVAGDKLKLEIDADNGAHAVVTTPAAGKFYRSTGARAAQINHFHVAAGTTLEWLPQETIVYNQANASMQTTVELATGARFIGWEMICLGLPASKQPFDKGRLLQRFEIFQDGRPLCIEPFEVRGEDPVLTAPWDLAGQPVMGTLVATTGKADLRETLRGKIETMACNGQFVVTQINGVTLCRYLGSDTHEGLGLFLSAWKVLRPAVTDSVVCVPRIWAT